MNFWRPNCSGSDGIIQRLASDFSELGPLSKLWDINYGK